jgi:hypothetical protein
MINFKQLELARKMFNQIKEHYPDVELKGIEKSGVYPDHVWVELFVPENDAETAYDEYDVLKFAGHLTIDLLVNYGYHISAVACAKETNPVT